MNECFKHITLKAKILLSFKGIYALFVVIFIFCVETSGQNEGDTAKSKENLQKNITINPLDSTKTKIDTLNFNSPNGLDFPIDYNAEDSIIFYLQKKIIYLYGNAYVKYDNMSLAASIIEVDLETKKLHAFYSTDSTGKKNGLPLFKDDKDSFRAEDMVYEFENKKGIVTNVMTQKGEDYVYGEKVLRDSQENIYVRGARYTTCNAPEPHFHIKADKFKMMKEKFYITGPANLYIANVPTPLVLPFGLFPQQKERTHGIIFPEFGEDRTNGFVLRNLGYYYPVNDYLDLKLLTTIYFRNRFGASFNARFKKRYKYSGNFSFGTNSVSTGERNTPTFATNRDYNFNLNYTLDPKARPGISLSANINYVTSSNFYRNTISSVEDLSRSNITSGVTFGTSLFKDFINLNSSIRLQQDLVTNIVDLELPSLALTYKRIKPFSKLKTKNKFVKGINISLSTNAINKLKVNNENLFKFGNSETFDSTLGFSLRPNVLDSFQSNVRHNINFSTSGKVFKYFNLVPSAAFQEYWFFERTTQTWDSEKDTLIINPRERGFYRGATYNFSLSLNTQVFGLWQNRNTKAKVKAIRNVLQPSISLNYRPDFNTSANGWRKVQRDTTGQFTEYNIYSNGANGIAGGAENGGLGFALIDNIEMKVLDKNDSNAKTKKIKLIDRISASTNYNFLADSLKLANIALSGGSKLFNAITINFNANYSPYQYVKENNQFKVIDKYLIEDRKQIARFLNGGLNFTTSYREIKKALFGTSNKKGGLRMTGQGKKEKSGGTENQLKKDINTARPDYNFELEKVQIPFNLSVRYNYNLSNNFGERNVSSHNVDLRGDIQLTPKWKIGYNTSYRFNDKEFGRSSFDFTRNLHCWQLTFNWVPFGIQRSYLFNIAVQSPRLKDLKVKKQGNWWEESQ